MLRSCLVLVLFGCLTLTAAAADPCVSGLAPGQKPGPYSSVICTGAQRGKPFCFICDNADRPAVLIFARSLGDPLGKFARQLDGAVQANQGAKLNAWVTFLHKDESSMSPKVVEWGKKHAITTMPLGVFEDEVGPPAYRLAADADVTIILFVNRKVVANFAFRASELTEPRAAEVMKALPKILPEKK